jgi:hypothetical protein
MPAPCITGSGAAKVSSPGEDTPKARRAFADSLALLDTFEALEKWARDI